MIEVKLSDYEDKLRSYGLVIIDKPYVVEVIIS